MTETPFSKAMKWIAVDGWSQGDHTGAIRKGYCLWSSIDSREAVEFMKGIMGWKRTTDIFEWNDASLRTEDDVKVVLQAMHEAWLEKERAMDIGEEKKEVEFEPLQSPVEEPVETPEKELEPA